MSGDSITANEVILMKGLPRPGISEAKKLDLIALCNSGQIPAGYRDFYNTLPVGDVEAKED